MEKLTRLRGKYSFLVDQILHDMTMSGCDDECGDVSERGVWHGLIKGPVRLSPPMADVTYDVAASLSAADRDYLAYGAGFIVREDDQGHVSATRYITKGALDEAWEKVQEDEADYQESVTEETGE